MNEPIFSFAVIADSHVNPPDAVESSPYQAYRYTNARLRNTVVVLNALDIRFVVHVGDMVHPVPESSSHMDSVKQFRRAVKELKAPLHLVAGNHDIGDKTADYVPAGSIKEENIGLYESNFGKMYYGFDVEDCHFAVINTSLINSGFAIERMQQQWLEEDLQSARGKRIILFIHYPPFIESPQEPGHYDNLDEPGRSWLLGLIEKHTPEVVFTGHVHTFFYNHHAGTDVYSLPSVGFARADYTEMFRIGQPAANENGRNDPAKLAFAVVDVYEDRIITQLIRTELPPDQDEKPIAQRHWRRIHPKSERSGMLGIDLRYAWNEVTDIPYSSMLDEFQRKKARNDYPIMCLWELGVRKLRIPVGDLLDGATRARVVAMAGNGSAFTVFTFGVPSAEVLKVLKDCKGLVSALEVVLRWPLDSGVVNQLVSLKANLGLPLVVSRFWNASSESRNAKETKLLVDHGFSVKDEELIHSLASTLPRNVVDRVVFRISSAYSATESIMAARDLAARCGFAAQVHLRIASDHPAIPENDEWKNMERVLEGAISAFHLAEADIFIDTLADSDRGYFPRTGLVDRRFNPRLSGAVLRNLHGVLSCAKDELDAVEWRDFKDCRIAFLIGPGGTSLVVIPHEGKTVSEVTVNTPDHKVKAGTALKTLNLMDGSEGAAVVASKSGSTAVQFRIPIVFPTITEVDGGHLNYTA